MITKIVHEGKLEIIHYRHDNLSNFHILDHKTINLDV